MADTHGDALSTALGPQRAAFVAKFRRIDVPRASAGSELLFPFTIRLELDTEVRLALEQEDRRAIAVLWEFLEAAVGDLSGSIPLLRVTLETLGDREPAEPASCQSCGGTGWVAQQGADGRTSHRGPCTACRTGREAALVAMLRRVQWGHGLHQCPVCLGEDPEWVGRTRGGHRATCALAALLDPQHRTVAMDAVPSAGDQQQG